MLDRMCGSRCRVHSLCQALRASMVRLLPRPSSCCEQRSMNKPATIAPVDGSVPSCSRHRSGTRYFCASIDSSPKVAQWHSESAAAWTEVDRASFGMDEATRPGLADRVCSACGDGAHPPGRGHPREYRGSSRSPPPPRDRQLNPHTVLPHAEQALCGGIVVLEGPRYPGGEREKRRDPRFAADQ